MLNQAKREKLEWGILLCIVALMMAMVWHYSCRDSGFQRYNQASVSYEKAVVEKIVEQELTLSGAEEEYFTGVQKVIIRFREGDQKGETMELEHYVTLTHNVPVKQGTKVILCVDRPEHAQAYYTIYNYDRTIPLIGILLGFILLLLLIGRYRGLRACIGLCFTLTVIVCYMMPNLYDGNQPWITILTAIASATVVSCFCISGLEERTLYHILNTVAGTLSAAVIYFFLMHIFPLSVGMMEEAESLQLISNATGLSLHSILFSGVMIGALGAVMDVAVSLGSALWEIKENAPSLSRKMLVQSGMNIGKDMIGTMANTLILAFLGGSLPALFVYLSYGVQRQQFLSSDFLAMEVAMGIAGSTAVILTVPISALVWASVLGKGETQ